MKYDLAHLIKHNIPINMFKLRIWNNRALILYPNNLIRTFSNPTKSSEEEEKEKELKRIAINASIDDPPTTCCQSGCANCVYIEWAKALTAQMKSSPDLAQKIINMVEDPGMKAYLELELRLLSQKK